MGAVTRPNLSPVEKDFDDRLNIENETIIGYIQVNYDTGEVDFLRERKY